MKLMRGIALASSLMITSTVLALANIMVRYETASVRAHGARIRRLLPVQLARFVGPALPAIALLGFPLTATLDDRDAWSSVGGWVAWAVICLGAAEAYAVCLRREVWIPEFEPWFVAERARPLGGDVSRDDDRRIQQQFRVLCIYTATPIVLALSVSFTSSLAVILPLVLMIAKLFSFSSTQGEFETAVHWHMHCRVLDMAGRPRWTRSVVFAMTWFVGPVNGYIPHVYETNHILIHHAENSGPDDIHSPLPYNRTSYLEFSYFAQRMIGSLLLGSDLWKDPRCRRQHRLALATGIGGFWAITAGLMWSGRLLGAWLVLAVFHRAVASARSQIVWHGLIDPGGPFDALASAILWLPSREMWDALLAAPPDVGRRPRGRLPAAQRPNQAIVPTPGTDWAFYDNYHLVHHLHPRAHFSEFPELLQRYVPLIQATGCPVLLLSGMRHFARHCWSRDYDALALSVIAGPSSNVHEYLVRRLAPRLDDRSPVAELTEGSFWRQVDDAIAVVLRRRRRGGSKTVAGDVARNRPIAAHGQSQY